MPRRISRNALLLILIAIILLVTRVASPSPVNAATPTDGRINQIPWANSWGAIAVYCVDQFDHPGATFTGGGIKILSSTGQTVFFAPESLIKAASIQADKIGGSVLIFKQGHYSLYALPHGLFQINTDPDKEGKTFIAKWTGCIPVGPGPDQGGACVPVIPTCRNFEACVVANNGDPSCKGIDAESYCGGAC